MHALSPRMSPLLAAPGAYALVTFAVCLVAAAFDWKTGRIPNALTYGALLVALPLHAWLSGPGMALESIEWSAVGAVACVFPLVIGFRLGWVGGGDVKLIAAMGALGGISSGVESVFLAMLCACAFVFVRLCYEGVFFRTVGNGLAVAYTKAFVKGRAIEARSELTSTLRFGPFALAGAALSLIMHGGWI